jgi:NitT/TauT family transport system permease protein
MRSIPVKKNVNQLIFGAGVLVLWEGLALLKIWPPYLFPTPHGVGESLWDGFKDHSLLIGIEVSLRRVVIGYVISVVLGVLLGALLASNKFLEDTLGRVILGLQSLPSACWVPIALLWFGLSETAIIFVTITGSLLAVTQATKAGFDNVPRILSMAGRNLGAKGPQLFWHVLLPASMPYLVDGLRQGWAFAWRSLITGEMIYISLGLGQLLMAGRDNEDINLVVAVMVLIAALGYAVDSILFRRLDISLRNKWGMETAASTN